MSRFDGGSFLHKRDKRKSVLVRGRILVCIIHFSIFIIHYCYILSRYIFVNVFALIFFENCILRFSISNRGFCLHIQKFEYILFYCIICTVVKNFVAGIGIKDTLCIYPAFFKPLCHLKNTLSVIADGVIFARNQQYG